MSLLRPARAAVTLLMVVVAAACSSAPVADPSGTPTPTIEQPAQPYYGVLESGYCDELRLESFFADFDLVLDPHWLSEDYWTRTEPPSDVLERSRVRCAFATDVREDQIAFRGAVIVEVYDGSEAAVRNYETDSTHHLSTATGDLRGGGWDRGSYLELAQPDRRFLGYYVQHENLLVVADAAAWPPTDYEDAQPVFHELLAELVDRAVEYVPES